MAIPTDRGYVILSKDAVGKITVSVSVTQPNQGRSSQIFAEHVGEPKVTLGRGIKLVTSGNITWSTMPVQVFVDPAGVVNIMPISSKGMLSRK